MLSLHGPSGWIILSKWCLCDCFLQKEYAIYLFVVVGLETISSEIRLIWRYVKSRELRLRVAIEIHQNVCVDVV